jgi:Cu/Zn superoxide dismutase
MIYYSHSLALYSGSLPSSNYFNAPIEKQRSDTLLITAPLLQNTHGRQNPKDGRNRHVGDLGNLFTQHSHEPITEVTILDTIITLDKTKSNGITGRTFVVHAFEDDLGKGGDEESLRTGNAGDRLACGIVVPENY